MEKTISMKALMDELDNLFSEKIINYGFKRKKKMTYIKNIGEAVYGISFSTTKIMQQDRIHIYVILSLNFEILNKLMMYLMNDYSFKGMQSIVINAVNLKPSEGKFSFYVDKETNISELVDEIINDFEKYALHIFDNIDTYKKLQNEINDDGKMIKWLVFKKEWFVLALAIILKNASLNSIIKKNSFEFDSNDETVETLLERANDYNKILEIIK